MSVKFLFLPPMEQHECIIIGSGPAGYTAAIYGARADLSPVMYVGFNPVDNSQQQLKWITFQATPMVSMVMP